MKARTAAANQMHSLTDTAPDELRAKLRGLTTLQRARTLRAITRRRRHDPGRRREDGRCVGRVSLARAPRRDHRTRHARSNTCSTRSPRRCSPVTASATKPTGALLCAAGDNPERLNTEGGYAALCGIVTRRDLFRQDQPASTQPRRRPPSQLRALDHRHGPHPQQPPTDHQLHRTTHNRRTLETRSHPLPQTLRRTRDLQRHPRHHATTTNQTKIAA